MNKYIMDTKNKFAHDAGYKARVDIATVLKKSGFIEKDIYIGKNKKRIFKEILCQSKQLIKILNSLDDNSLLVVQYPWNTMYYGFAKEIRKISQNKGIKSIVIIHDLNSYRKASNVSGWYYKYIVREIDYLNSFNYVICHNSKMMNILMEKGIAKEKLVSLNIFDYLLSNKSVPVNKVLKSEIRVIVAGNLSKAKSGYLYQLENMKKGIVRFELFGPNYTGNSNDIINYNGSYSPDELPEYLCDGFGLVWDGDCIDKCHGSFGEYMRINNPHKLSLYIASGIPVIVWSESAVAGYVKANGIGICIDSLADIETIISQLSQREIDEMINNVANIREIIINGKSILNALGSIAGEEIW